MKEKLTGKDGPTDKAVSAAVAACAGGVPVHPAHGFPQERVSTLREDVQAVMARGSTPMIPDSTDDFDPDEFRED
jgi:hypothetical protein